MKKIYRNEISDEQKLSRETLVRPATDSLLKLLQSIPLKQDGTMLAKLSSLSGKFLWQILQYNSEILF